MTLLYDLAPSERGLGRKPNSPIWTFPEDYIGRLRRALNKENPAMSVSDRLSHHPIPIARDATMPQRSAFADRLALSHLAEQTIDPRYSIREPDATGRLLAERLLPAADRRVREG